MEKLQFRTYADGTVANVCWTPDGPTFGPWEVAPHLHTFYEIVFVESGSGGHVINGRFVPVQPGHLALMGPGCLHDPRGLVGRACFWVFVFNAQAVESQGWAGAIYASESGNLGAGQLLVRRTYESEHNHLLLHVPAANRREIRSTFRTIQRENSAPHVGTVELIRAHLSVLLIGLLRLHPPGRNGAFSADKHPIVDRAMTYIDRHYRETITLFDIAHHVGRSPAHVTDLIRRYTGRSAMAWLSDRRLTEARSMILTGKLSVGQVADALGYKSARHFSHMFKRRFGDPPLRWRHRISGTP